jgi:CheY-like chemotaxis protein
MYSSKPPRKLRVLVADDDDEMRAFVTAALQADGCSTVEAHDGRELPDLLKNALDSADLRPDVIVADVKMPGLSGLGALAALQHSKWDLPVVLITVLTMTLFTWSQSALEQWASSTSRSISRIC